MQQQAAYQLAHKVLDIIFTQADSERLDAVYHRDAKIHIGEYTFGYDEIVNRIALINTAYRKRHHKLQDVTVVNDLIVFQDQQIAIDTRTEQAYNHTLSGVYKLQEGKVKEAWMLTGEKVDYLQEA